MNTEHPDPVVRYHLPLPKKAVKPALGNTESVAVASDTMLVSSALPLLPAAHVSSASDSNPLQDRGPVSLLLAKRQFQVERLQWDVVVDLLPSNV